MMNKANWIWLTMTAALLAGPTYADDESTDVGEDTMVVIEGDMTPEDIVSVIQLPEAASETARERAAKGLETANAAREDGQAFGREMSEGRGDAGREIGEAAREAAANIAQDARESASEIAEQARESAADAAAEARQNAADAAANARANADGRDGGRP
jgi:flagellar biosynthesis/type III secretory pathway protein FliH